MSGLLGTFNNAPPSMLLEPNVPTMEVKFLTSYPCHICMFDVISYLNLDHNSRFTCFDVLDAV